MINYFLKQFSYGELEHVKIGKKYFLVSKGLQEVKEKIPLVPEIVGVYLGEEKKSKQGVTIFSPSVAFLDMLSKKTDRVVVANDKAEWLFLCGRELRDESIVSKNVESGLVIVKNNSGEVLGLGKIEKGGVKNILDKGDFLRRERNHKQFSK
ncbi:hypothetical protein MEO93_27250 [Dolichospermum sp. ST_sed3]|nr:hypothetical protein [Dolichospermum sp. ST_sed3]